MASYKKSVKRGFSPKTKTPYMSKPSLTCCYGFSITSSGRLRFPLGNGEFAEILLNEHTLKEAEREGLQVRSFTLTPDSLSLSLRKFTPVYTPKSFIGIDRNASNVSCGNEERIVQFDLAKVEGIARNTRQIVRSFNRNDVRIGKRITSEYGARRKERINQILNVVSKAIVQDAFNTQSAIVFEDIRGLRKPVSERKLPGKKFSRKDELGSMV